MLFKVSLCDWILFELRKSGPTQSFDPGLGSPRWSDYDLSERRTQKRATRVRVFCYPNPDHPRNSFLPHKFTAANPLARASRKLSVFILPIVFYFIAFCFERFIIQFRHCEWQERQQKRNTLLVFNVQQFEHKISINLLNISLFFFLINLVLNFALFFFCLVF